MSVAEHEPYKKYTANGSTTSFALGFPCESKSHLVVTVDDQEANQNAWSLVSGSAVFSSAPKGGSTIELKRKTPLRRDKDFKNYDGSFNANSINKEFDWVWLKLQELGVADLLLKLYVDRLHQEQKEYIDQKDDELKEYLLEETRKQGVALDQLDDYYNYLMERLAQIAVSKGWDASFVVDGNLTQHERNLGIESIDQLRRTEPSKKGDRVYLTSVNLGQNEGGGEFIAAQKAGLVDDGGLIVASPDPLIFWVRVNYDYVTPEIFGAVGNNIADDTIPLQKSLMDKKPTILGAKKYRTTKTVYTTVPSKEIHGAGELLTFINKDGNAIAGFGSRVIQNKTVDIDTDAVLSLLPDTYDWYAQGVRLSGVQLAYTSVARGIGLYIPLICQSSLKNIFIKDCQEGVKSTDAWMMDFERISSYAKAPFQFGTNLGLWERNNTSCTFTSCFAHNAGAGFYGWDIYRMQYSVFNACGNDFTGTEADPAEGLMRLQYSDVVINDMGCEHVHAYAFIHALTSIVKINGGNFQNIHNKYRKSSPSWGTATALFRVLTNSYISLENVKFDIKYDSTNSGGIVTSLAYLDDNSTFRWVDSTCFATIEEVVSGSSTTPNKFGIYLGNNTNVHVDSYSDKYDVIRGNSTDLGRSVLKNPTNTHHTYRNLNTKGHVNSRPVSLATEDLNSLRASKAITTFEQEFAVDATTARNYPRAANSYLIEQIGGGSSTSRFAQFAYEAWSGSSEIYYRVAEWNAAPHTWRKIYHTGNTTVDSNGFIKAASPVVSVYADKIELNEEAQQQNIVFEKLGVGDYLIKGSSGFSTEGWYIEIPKDANGNVLFAVVYDSLENGDISVKTFMKKLDIETASIIADLENPLDINNGRWINIRLNS